MQTNESPRLTRRLKTATSLAAFFLSFPKVQDVFLFGSLSRGEVQRRGSDIDLILVTDEPTAERFRFAFWQPLGFVADDNPTADELAIAFAYSQSLGSFAPAESGFYGSKLERLDVALAILGLTVNDLWTHEAVRESVLSASELDLFLFPSDWMGWPEELQEAFGTTDPMFMTNVIHDALRYNPTTQTFETASLTHPH